VVFALFLFYLELFNLGGGHAAFLAGHHAYLPTGFCRWTVEGIGFSGLMIYVMKSEWKIKNGNLWKTLTLLGQISYSFYLIHLFVIFLFIIIFDKFGFSSEIRMLSFAPAFIFLFGASWVSYKFIETPLLLKRVKYVN
jgi:peptidoglycan/LPS O-acetylase OafA/YrhL